MHGLADCARAAQLFESRDAHQRPQRNPVAGSAARGDSAHAHRTKRRGTEARQWFQAGLRRVRIFEHQAAVAQCERGVKARVGRRHLDLFIARKIRRDIGLDEEDQAAVHWQVRGAAHLHG